MYCHDLTYWRLAGKDEQDFRVEIRSSPAAAQGYEQQQRFCNHKKQYTSLNPTRN